MKKIVYSILATVAGLVLLFSYRTSLDQPTASPIITGTKAATTTGGATPSASATASASAAPVAPSAAPSPAPKSGSTGSSSRSSSGLKDGTYTGASADTRYGAVQVRISVSNGVISQVAVPRYPHESGTDQQINSYALPQLADETVTAQSARIDMVSGATYTSQGYLESLQSAIDKARA
jgi:uncharacterized protein with FMN-binding domain